MHHVGPIKAPPPTESLPKSEQNGTEGFKEDPQLSPHHAENRKSLGLRRAGLKIFQFGL